MDPGIAEGRTIYQASAQTGSVRGVEPTRYAVGAIAVDWRRMRSTASAANAGPPHPTGHLVGCPECDLLLRVDLPGPGETARCPRCRFALASGVAEPFVFPLAYSLTALILMVVSLTFPFLAVTEAGLENSMTLAKAMTSLADFGANGVAVVVAAFVLFVPATMMAAVVMLTILLLRRRPTRLLVPLARSVFHLDAWCMADVFAIGVIVSLVKLSTMADVVLGIAFWAYLAFAVCFLLTVTSLDRLTVWTTIDALGDPA
jgi:paraquat-inducible protein A